jgi:hypothetical protein
MKTILTAVIISLSVSCGVPKLASPSDWFRTTIDGPATVAERVDLVFTWALWKFQALLVLISIFFISPDRDTVVFIPLKNLPFLLNHPRFNTSLPTVIYVHGWMENGKLDLSSLAVRSAYLTRGDHNVISVDWSYYARNVSYSTTYIPQTKIVSLNFEINSNLKRFLLSFSDRWDDCWIFAWFLQPWLRHQTASFSGTFTWVSLANLLCKQ